MACPWAWFLSLFYFRIIFLYSMSKLWPTYGKPTNSDPRFEINPSQASGTTPQAWLHKGNWFYNYPWAIIEAESRGERLPTKDELLSMINSEKWNCIEKARILNLPFVGFRDADGDNFSFEGMVAYLWSSSTSGDSLAYYAYLFQDGDSANTTWDDRGHGMTVRSITK